jgi:hypothetical protein
VSEPQIQLPVKRVMCQMHGEPFRSQWPLGYAVFMTKVTFKALESEKLQRVTRGRVEQIDRALEIRPACMWVPVDTIMEAYRESGIGTIARCNVCGERVLGTSFKTQRADYSHICFGCIAENAKTHHESLERQIERRERRRAKRRRR